MTVIGESSSTRTEWTLVDDGVVVEHAFTVGLNPYFQSRREISHSIRLELPEAFFKRRWTHVYFYGAGCSNPEKNKIVESSLVAQFKTPVTVMSDLLGAARGLLVHERGLACILGTGSNSCLYDGHDIVRNVRPLGFILGDEGSGSALGRIFLGDVLKGLAPRELAEAFFDKNKVTPDDIMDAVYNNASANRNLRDYSFFLSEHLDHDYVVTLIDREFSRFFERNLCQYADYDRLPVAFVGSVATTYSELLLDVASRYGVHIQKIVRNSMPGLVTYHTGGH
ncbi:MAG: hypothetical protein J5980_09410 [Muribaculaceae bacterium]|nr:hypothetical protein [Muribaculaceae bacterium]